MPTNINPHIFRAYDIRGIAGSDLTEETVYLIGKGIGTYLIRKYNTKTMAVGMDIRTHSPSLQKAYIKGITETGINVTNIGVSISPMVYWATCAMDFDSATNITASHNPKKYNGIKVVTKGAHSICGDELQEALEIIENEDFITAKKPGKMRAHSASANELKNLAPPVLKRSGLYQEKNIWNEYKKDLLGKIKIARPLKIVIDAGNGTAGPFAPEFLRELGCEVIELYCDPDGTFPNHEANPEELENMRDLIEAVKEEKADLGIGFDGDGDRIGVVDEKGHMYSSDFMLLLLVRDIVTRIKKPKIVFDVKVSKTIINDMVHHGAIPVMSKTGHSFIEKKMKEIDAPLAGEVSGHMFFAENFYGFDDAFLAAAKIIEILSKSDKPLSDTFTDLPETFTTPEFKAHCPDNKKFPIVQSLVDHFTKNYDCITIDGVRINFDENSWGAVRASNTTPCLTLRFESQSKQRLQKIQEIMVKELKKHPEVNLDWYKS